MPRRLRLRKTLPPAEASRAATPSAHVTAPRLGDVIVRANDGRSFDVVDAATLKPIAESLASLDAAIAVARIQGETIWRQTVDRRGRAIDEPTRLDP
jgi:hypothetical protein